MSLEDYLNWFRQPRGQQYSQLPLKENGLPVPPPPPRNRLYLLCAAAVVLVLIITFGGPNIAHAAGTAGAVGSARLHLLTPGTRSNVRLCELFLSAFALSYPTPIVVNWAMDFGNNTYKAHLAKVEGVAKYLDRLVEQGGAEDDLVFINDGYDVWFQLGPDVLLKRYYEMMARLDKEARDHYGEELAVSRDMRHTVLVASDKFCWPNSWKSSACWAVPTFDMDPFTFGPRTTNNSNIDKFADHSLPRWLNSGNILGPVKDLQKIYHAALVRIENHYGHPGDQYYFGQLYGLQSQARLQGRPDLLAKMQEGHNDAIYESSDAYDPADDEYHIAVDHNADLFQVMGVNKQFTAWKQASQLEFPTGATPDERKLRSYYDRPLPAEVQQSKSPYHFLKEASKRVLQWADVPLLHNTATHRIPVLLHLNLHKGELMPLWWSRLWFQRDAKAIREARLMSPPETLLLADVPVGGKMWYAAGPSVVVGSGVWSDDGKWLKWENTCREYEEELFYPGVYEQTLEQ